MKSTHEPHRENGSRGGERRRGRFTVGRICAGLGLMAVLAGSVAYAVSRPERTVTTRSEEAYAHYEKGMEAMRSHFLPEAAREWSEAVKIDSTFAMAWVRLARLSFGDRPAAERCLAMARAQMGRIREKEQLHVRLLGADMAQNDAEKLALVAELLKKFPDDVEMLMIAGNRAFARGDFQEALSCFSKLVAQDPSVGQGYNMMGYTLTELGRYAEATEALQKYTFLTPGQPNPHDSLGELYLRTGRYDAAIAEFDRATALKADFGWSYYHKAMVLESLGRYNDAIAEMTIAKREAPNPPDSQTWYRFEICLQSEAGNPERALALIEELNEKFPNEVVNPFLAGFVHARNGNVREAQAALDEITLKVEEASKLDIKPAYARHGESTILELSGFIAEARGDWALAAEQFSKQVEKKESKMDNSIKVELMRCLVEAGRPAEALETGSDVLSMNPNDAKASFWSGAALQAMGRSSEALPHFRRAIEVLANADSGNEILAGARERLGRL